MPLLQIGDNASKIILPNRNYHAEQSEALVVSTEREEKIVAFWRKWKVLYANRQKWC